MMKAVRAEREQFRPVYARLRRKHSTVWLCFAAAHDLASEQCEIAIRLRRCSRQSFKVVDTQATEGGHYVADSFTA